MPETEWEACDLGICAANKGHEGTCDEASGWAYDEFEEIQIARDYHQTSPAKWVKCPECHLFSASPWEQTFGTQNGTSYSWGGVCKTHGAWSEAS